MANPLIQWEQLSPSSQHALSLAAAARRPGESGGQPTEAEPVEQRAQAMEKRAPDIRQSTPPPIDSIKLLAGIFWTHPGDGELQQLLDYFSISTDTFFHHIDETGDWTVTPPQVAELTGMPTLDSDAEQIVAVAAGLAEEYPSESPPLVHLRHLLGGVLGLPEVPACAALQAALRRGNVPERDLDTVVSNYPAFLGGNWRTFGQFLEATISRRLAPDIWQRFSPSSRHALSHADRLRRLEQGQFEVHMEHLIAGLYEKPGGPAQRLFAPVLDASQLAELIEKAVENPVPVDLTYDGTELPDLPPLSSHAEEALQHAQQIAARAGSPTIRSRHLLAGALSVEGCSVIKSLTGAGIRREDIVFDDSPENVVAPAGGRRIAGFGTDTTTGEDLLDITRDVRALCSVIAAHDVRPPLAIGLFGDWGSGKSFFMEKMYAYVTELKDVARTATRAPNGSSAYCPNIVQIKFNAWHYIDSDNLWASLAAEIFEELSKALDDDAELIAGLPDAATARERLMSATVTRKAELAQAEQARNAAEVELTTSEEKLRSLLVDADDMERRLDPKIVVREVAQEIVTHPDIQANIQQIRDAVDLEKAGVNESDVAEQILGSSANWTRRDAFQMAFDTSAAKQRLGRWLVPVAGALLIAGLSALGIALLTSEYINSLFASAAVAITTAMAALGPIIVRAQQIFAKLRSVRASYVEEGQRELAAKRQRLEADRELIREKLAIEQKRVAQTSAEIVQLTRQIDELRADWKLGSFIRDRQGSTVYTSHRGIIAQAHDDFEQLSALLTEATTERRKRATVPASDDATALPIIDRIILYIDDLDRCPEDQVVKVLQAVHLLLAFPLFVVVVGVDSRWLLHSLRQHSEAFQERADDDDKLDADNGKVWQSTPLNYLEKIFQIPFALRPMEPSGFGRLIDDLTTPKEEAAAEPTTPTAPTITRDDGVAVEAAVDSIVHESVAGRQPVTGDASVQAPVTTGDAVDEDRYIIPRPDTIPIAPLSTARPDANPAYLMIDSLERDFMKAMAGMIGSPRAAKRFVNIYRLLKASFEERTEAPFVTDPGRLQYQAPMLLLAILTGYPAEAMELFDELCDASPSQSWWAFVESVATRWIPPVEHGHEPSNGARQLSAELEQIAPNGGTRPAAGSRNEPDDGDAERWAELAGKLQQIREWDPELIAASRTCEDFIGWVPHVARYSYLSRNLLLRHAAEKGKKPVATEAG